MIIVDPVAMGDTAFTRPSPKWVYDRTGALVEVPANTLAVTYDPSDLSKAPYALIEPEATNLLESTDRLEAVKWRFTACDYVVEKGATDAATPLSGLMRPTRASSQHALVHTVTGGVRAAQHTFSVEARAEGMNRFRVTLSAYNNNNFAVVFNLNTGTYSGAGQGSNSGKFDKASIKPLGDDWYRCELTGWPSLIDPLGTFDVSVFLLADNLSSTFVGDGSSGIRFRRWQLERGDKATSFIERPTIFTGRGSPKRYYDSAGLMQTAEANQLAYTYDPSTLDYLGMLLEGTATNLVGYSQQLGNAYWSKSGATVLEDVAIAPDGTLTGDKIVEGDTAATHLIVKTAAFALNTARTVSVFLKAAERTCAIISIDTTITLGVNLLTGEVVSTGGVLTPLVQRLPNGWWRVGFTATPTAGSGNLNIYTSVDGVFANRVYQGDGISGIYAWGVQVEAATSANAPSSYIHTVASTVTRWGDGVSSPAVTRAADVIGPNAGLVYSNVPLTEPPYDANATYAKGAVVHDPATKIVYWSMVDANKGNALSDPAKWNKRTPTNRWAMLDDRNDTQTENPEEIVLVLSARAITQGLYLGNLDATEIRVAMTDLQRGLVYREERNLIVSRSKSSFYRWAFTRLRRRTYFLTLKLPVYAHSLVTILIRRPGATAKCGMCMLGPAIDAGLSHYGLSTELKDFSDTSFNPDGTSKTVVRGYAKRMSVDVEVDNDEIDDVEEELIGFRQKVVVYVGTVLFGSAMLVGKFSSLKKVIPGLRKSRVSLQIEGVVSK